jgi:hypothetical protein
VQIQCSSHNYLFKGLFEFTLILFSTQVLQKIVQTNCFYFSISKEIGLPTPAKSAETSWGGINRQLIKTPKSRIIHLYGTILAMVRLFCGRIRERTNYCQGGKIN